MPGHETGPSKKRCTSNQTEPLDGCRATEFPLGSIYSAVCREGSVNDIQCSELRVAWSCRRSSMEILPPKAPENYQMTSMMPVLPIIIPLRQKPLTYTRQCRAYGKHSKATRTAQCHLLGSDPAYGKWSDRCYDLQYLFLRGNGEMRLTSSQGCLCRDLSAWRCNHGACTMVKRRPVWYPLPRTDQSRSIFRRTAKRSPVVNRLPHPFELAD